MNQNNISLERVINGLEYHSEGNCFKSENDETGCPYWKDSFCSQHLCSDALALLKAQELPTNASTSSAIECLLHPQDADDSDMAKAIDTAVRALTLLKAQEPIEARLHLCESCTKQYPDCNSDYIEFGCGYGHDNVIGCDAYTNRWAVDHDCQQDYEAATEMTEYCKRYEPTYNPEDGSL